MYLLYLTNNDFTQQHPIESHGYSRAQSVTVTVTAVTPACVDHHHLMPPGVGPRLAWPAPEPAIKPLKALAVTPSPGRRSPDSESEATVSLPGGGTRRCQY